MYYKVRNLLLITLAVQLIIMLLLVGTRITLPVMVLVVILIVCFHFEGIVYSRSVRYRGTGQPPMWYMVITREERRRQREKERIEYLKRMKGEKDSDNQDRD